MALDRRSILLEMRKSSQLKGVKPCFVLVKYKTEERTYSGEYILSMNKTVLYFQKISKFFSLLHPKDDFQMDITKYCAYKFLHLRGRSNFTLYKEDGETFSIDYMTGTRETFATEDNMVRIAKELKALGLQDMEDDNNGKE